MRSIEKKSTIMTDLNGNIPISLSVNGIKPLIKSKIFSDYMQNSKIQIYVVYKKPTLNMKNTNKLTA